MTAELHVLSVGYADERVASTVVLVRDGEHLVVVDPGMVSHRGKILDPIAALGLEPDRRSGTWSSATTTLTTP